MLPVYSSTVTSADTDGHNRGTAVKGATSALTCPRGSMRPVPPGMRARQPRVVALHAENAPAGLIRVTAAINDGDSSTTRSRRSSTPRESAAGHGIGAARDARQRILAREEGPVAVADHRIREHRPCARRDLRARRRSSRRELRCLPTPHRSGTAVNRADALRVRPSEHPSGTARLYQQAGAKFNIDWSFLASIGAQECGNGSCTGTNSSGCAGPMQIAYVRGSGCSPGSGPTLWEKYEVSARPGKAPSINDPLTRSTPPRESSAKTRAPPTGGSFAEYHQAACNYFGACGEGTIAYAEEVMARAVQYGFTGNGAPAPTSPALAEPVSTGGCEASTFSPEAASSTQIVKIAESQVGTGESPEGSNCTKYGPCEEWCSLFAAWVWQHAGVLLPGATATYGYSGSLYTWAKEHGGKVLPATATPAPGDLVFYGNGPAESEHVGIVTRIDRNGRITTIDGNYSNHVTVVGPFKPAEATNAGQGTPIYGYAQPPATNPPKA